MRVTPFFQQGKFLAFNVEKPTLLFSRCAPPSFPFEHSRPRYSAAGLTDLLRGESGGINLAFDFRIYRKGFFIENKKAVKKTRGRPRTEFSTQRRSPFVN